MTRNGRIGNLSNYELKAGGAVRSGSSIYPGLVSGFISDFAAKDSYWWNRFDLNFDAPSNFKGFAEEYEAHVFEHFR